MIYPPQELENLGGVSFFKRLLDERDAHVPLVAAQFLLRFLQRENPAQFPLVVNTLLGQAVEANNEQIVTNPYLQIVSILRLRNPSPEQ